MGLRPRRVFRRLDRARLERRAVKKVMCHHGQALLAVGNAHDHFVACGEPAPLQDASAGYLDLLSEVFLVGRRPLTLCDEPRPHRRNRQGKIVEELHGDCTYGGEIRVFLRTAAREQPIALLTYLQTLLHEWVHHYDYEAWGDSVHCSGFYRRVGQLYSPARDLLKAQRGGKARHARP